jgi:hypothetical protein
MAQDLFVTFIDDDNVVHMLLARECHFTSMRGQMSIEIKGRVYHLAKNTNYTIGDLAGCLPQFNQAIALTNLNRPPEI